MRDQLRPQPSASSLTTPRRATVSFFDRTNAEDPAGTARGAGGDHAVSSASISRAAGAHGSGVGGSATPRGGGEASGGGESRLDRRSTWGEGNGISLVSATSLGSEAIRGSPLTLNEATEVSKDLAKFVHRCV